MPYNLAKNPNIGPVAGWPPHQSVEDSLNIIKTVFTRDECYAVLKEDVLIGCVELLIHPNCNHWWGEGSAELGYWIGEDYQGQGYATEASEALINRAFGELDIERIYASFRQENIASKGFWKSSVLNITQSSTMLIIKTSRFVKWL